MSVCIDISTGPEVFLEARSASLLEQLTPGVLTFWRSGVLAFWLSITVSYCSNLIFSSDLFISRSQPSRLLAFPYFRNYFSYLLIPRNLGPYWKKTHGTGASAAAINPNKLLAQATPNAANTVFLLSTMLRQALRYSALDM